MRRGGTFAGLLVVAMLALPAARASGAGCKGTPAFVGGKSVCLRAKAACKPKLNRRYLAYGFVCRKGKLRRASVAQRRRGAAILIGTNGLPSKADALQALAKVGVWLPGVKPRKGVVGRFTSGSGPLRWALAHRDGLTAKQRGALYELLARAAQPRARLATKQDEVDAALKQAIADVQARFGFGLGTTVVTATARDKGVGYAFTYPYDAMGEQKGPLAQCRIEIYPLALKTPDTLRVTMTHEITHCFQYVASGTLTLGLHVASWLMEGFAEWAGADIASASGTRQIDAKGLAENWQPYLDSPQISLFDRGYDAVGFFAQVRGVGLDPFKRWAAAENAGSNEAAHGAFFADPSEQAAYMNVPPAALFRRPDLGFVWDFHAAGVPKSHLEAEEVTVPLGGSEAIGAERWGSSIYKLVTPAPIVEVALGNNAEGLGLLRSGTHQYAGLAMTGSFCTRPQGCGCPDGTPLAALPLGKEALVGLAGKERRLELQVSGQTLETACKDVSGTDLVVSGAVSQRLTTNGSCEFGDGTWFGNFTSDNATGASAYVTIQFANFHGAGTYPIRGAMTAETPASQDHDFALFRPATGGDPYSESFSSNHNPSPTVGTVTVNEGGRGGSVSLVLHRRDGPSVTVSGRFACPEF